MNVQFEQTQRAPKSKQRDLKRKGMGNKPNASAALSEEDIQVLFEKDLLGSSRGNGNQRCTVYFDSTQCKIWQQRHTANRYYATVRTQKRSKYHSVLYRLTETTVEYESHSHWNEFERNNSPVWLFYSGEKKARV